MARLTGSPSWRPSQEVTSDMKFRHARCHFKVLKATYIEIAWNARHNNHTHPELFQLPVWHLENIQPYLVGRIDCSKRPATNKFISPIWFINSLYRVSVAVWFHNSLGFCQSCTRHTPHMYFWWNIGVWDITYTFHRKEVKNTIGCIQLIDLVEFIVLPAR